MPFSRDYLLEDGDEPPPRIPPAGGQGGGGGGGQAGNNLPSGNPGSGGPTVAPDLRDGGGWAGGQAPAPFQLPAYPRINIPGAPVFTPRQFVAPDRAALLRDPGYLARVQAGSDALERSAAARGALRTGKTLTDLVDYNQDFAGNEYASAYDRYLQQYDRQYKADYDAFTPELQRWQMRAGGERDAQLARYQMDLTRALRDSAPRYEAPFDPMEELGPPPVPPDLNGGPEDFYRYGSGDDVERYY